MTQLGSFDAVVMAGGFSRRMGTDKAALPHPVSKLPLLEHQLRLLAALYPQRRFVSARLHQTLPTLPADVIRINDDGEHGPLGGITATLSASDSDHLLVIAVDLPQLTRETLEQLFKPVPLAESGSIATTIHGVEPLVAIYPRQALPAMKAALATGSYRLKSLLSGALKPMMTTVNFSEATPFHNWNSPSDI
ncbi:MAG: molybdenum cofactor guanylyltransferase [Verrucomicrobiia bacterium]|tara:strand:+ start:5763 stop:6338 length:576 start_codon:yes stop_codon:yes gene_type:complete